LQAALATLEIELMQKNKEAEALFSQMTTRQCEAEEQKKSSTETSERLAEESKKIEAESAKIQGALAAAIHALESAQKAISGVTPKSLDELRRLQNPPRCVKLAMQATAMMVKDGRPERRHVGIEKGMILEFQAESMSDAIQERIQKDVLGNPEWDKVRIARASSVAGALAQWVESQMKYANLHTMLEPMTNHLNVMKELAADNKKYLEEQQNRIKQTEQQNLRCMVEYRQLMGAVLETKQEITQVKVQCARSKKLLDDLGSEKIRWEASSKGFADQKTTLVGDTTLQ